jgi:coenzyme PQQ precursor peptide PqqA
MSTQPRQSAVNELPIHKSEDSSAKSLFFDAWVEPVIEEIPIGMEINGYLPAE